MDDNRKKDAAISEEFIDSLRNAYTSDKEAGTEPCPMTETAIGYTGDELDAYERQKFHDHLSTCKSCLELVLDLYAAETESQENAGLSPKVLPALSNALAQQGDVSGTDSKFRRFKNGLLRFFSPMPAPKYIGAAAVACLAVIVIND